MIIVAVCFVPLQKMYKIAAMERVKEMDGGWSNETLMFVEEVMKRIKNVT